MPLIPTQQAGLASTPAQASTNGFVGWSPDPAQGYATLKGGSDGSAATAYATLTAYAVGKSVTYNGQTYIVQQAVLASNATPPDQNPSFARQGEAPYERVTATTGRKAYYR